ncbi:L-tyrosine decarboxylase [candidate division MSBL1 archaeon SCGC-AAA385D11]|uniref:Probable L-aspartate decarboxylase n=1 Tax=candidate division MSBL1 archaeon SCGC-AAA385D11 TaxID=1698286 RepID=A0A133VNE1_9EURY|nr:L-tyrosine decarboxylase [candidate division MSBL1 archaeon SCGC-AAA385D11]
MDEKGVKEEKVASILEEARSKDVPYQRVLSSMCTRPHPLAIEAHRMFIETNLGDKVIFPGTAELEEKAVRMMGEMVNFSEVSGYITTGGTESNVQALRAARNMSDIQYPNVIVPESAHFSFDKIADVLRIEVRKAPLDDEFRADVGEVENMVDEKTLAIVGIAGTTEHGQIDSIPALGKIALDNGIFFHVDAAFGGFVIPFLEKKYEFGFEIKGVDSITMDPHKMGLSTIPAGGLLFRDKSFIEALKVHTPYLTTKDQYSFVGTRSGAAVASAFAVMKSLGREGYRKIVRRCIDLTRGLMDELGDIGVQPLIRPPMNVVTLDVAGERVKERLYDKGWITSVTRGGALRLVIMPHVTEEVLDDFIHDLKSSI